MVKYWLRHAACLLAAGLLMGTAAGIPAGGQREGPNRSLQGAGSATEELPEGQVQGYEGPSLDPLSAYVGTSIKGTQNINISTYRLRIDGQVDKPLELVYEEVLAYPQFTKTVELICVEGWSARLKWRGVMVEDLLQAAGADEDAPTVIFHSADGYTTSLPRNYLRRNEILLAYEVNDQTLPKEHGYPFQLVAEARYGYKWAKWVTRIEVSDDGGFRGYWESRGYNQRAEVGGPMFGGE